MIFSHHNIFSQIKDSDQFFLVNLLSGNADILTAQKAREIQEGKYSDIDEYIEKGYLVDEKEEESRFKLKYLEFLQNQEQDEVQIFFVPQYSCNFDCEYCFQVEYAQTPNPLKEELLEAFFQYIDREFHSRKKYITLFGGEPFLIGKFHQENIKKIIEKANQRNLQIAGVTNGYTLEEYIDILKTASIKEIQVTLDGTRELHNKRRALRNGNETFDKIVSGIDLCLQNEIPINLRIVVDKENIDDLENLARFAIEKGWTDSQFFKTQLGRNYELHTCQADSAKLFSRVTMYEHVYEIVKRYPDFLKFHQPAFSISKFLFEKGELPDPLFDSCPATKTEWAFDYNGNIYSCTATAGKTGEILGTFYPEVTKKAEVISRWGKRNILSIDKCRSCNLALACGGGCASVAKNKTGEILSEDCRPVDQLMGMGISTYFAEEL
ncbi:MAG: radical SAM protein [SAR324 cluster bacterium]|nr:radical SAM protein [SAR324 cluster bacterium]